MTQVNQEKNGGEALPQGGAVGAKESPLRLPVVERFVSINGEGPRAGQLSAFIRLKGCNLHCSYCDTTWANEPDCPFTWQTVEELADYVLLTGVKCVTLTGGEPLLHAASVDLLRALAALPDLWVEVETNGSVDLGPAAAMRAALPESARQQVSFTMDVKLPGSGEGDSLHAPNLDLLQPWDAVKLVAGSADDLDTARDLIAEHGLDQRVQVFLSPVFGCVDPADMVEYMKAHDLTGVRLQLQLHKVIWPPDARGV